MPARGPALGVVETASVARGVVVADAALKRAPALLVSSRAVSGGKHLVVLEGGVAEVDEAMAAARAAAGDRVVDWVQLAAADDQVWPMLGGPVDPAYGPALGGAAPADWAGDEAAEAVAIVETRTVCSAIAAADAAVKCADVVVRDVRFAVDLAGKAYFTLTGDLDAIEAAAGAARDAARDHLADLEVIAQPAPDLRGRLFR